MEKRVLVETVLVVALLILGALGVAVVGSGDTRLHTYVCDVGQGDAILITLKNTQMLVDGGPDNRVMDCLARHMPFYDRTIEVVVLTHPQADHMGGLISVLQRYSVSNFLTVNVSNPTNQFAVMTKLLREKPTKLTFVQTGDEVELAENRYTKLVFDIVWPSREWQDAHEVKTNDLWNKSDGTDLNSYGVVGEVRYGKFRMLLTADADSPVDLAEMATGLLTPVDVLKVPHHGSKTGMLPEWLATVKPQIAIISVGKDNKYGHPAPETLKMLGDMGIPIYRTDVDGEVGVVSDGEKWWMAK